MSQFKRIAALIAVGGLVAAAGPSAASAVCPAPTSKLPKVYAIGSSTMGSVLGPMLKRLLKADGVKLERWGKASSGLARPDFHDWPRVAPGLMRRHKPDIVVVSLGTNDFQSIFHKKKWFKFGTERWKEIYSQRVDRLLTALAGKQKQRTVIWTGPTAFAGKKAEKRAPIINGIMKKRVEAFAKAGGKAVFVDSYARTSDGKGKALSRAKIDGKRVKIRTKDNIHLTTKAVQALMAEPIVAAMKPCFKVAKAKPPEKAPTKVAKTAAPATKTQPPASDGERPEAKDAPSEGVSPSAESPTRAEAETVAPAAEQHNSGG